VAPRLVSSPAGIRRRPAARTIAFVLARAYAGRPLWRRSDGRDVGRPKPPCLGRRPVVRIELPALLPAIGRAALRGFPQPCIARAGRQTPSRLQRRAFMTEQGSGVPRPVHGRRPANRAKGVRVDCRADPCFGKLQVWAPRALLSMKRGTPRRSSSATGDRRSRRAPLVAKSRTAPVGRLRPASVIARVPRRAVGGRPRTTAFLAKHARAADGSDDPSWANSQAGVARSLNSDDCKVAFAIARCAPRREQKQSCEPGLPDARIWARACARSGRDWRSDSWRSGRATNDRAHDASVADAVAGRPAGRGRMRSRKGAPSALRAQASRPRAMSWERSRILATCDRALPARVAGRCWITPEAVTPARLPLGMESGSRSCCPSA
jgi:hypothetical protein